MPNNRIYYAIQQVSMGPAGAEVELHGLQSVGVTSNFNLEQIFELGQLAIYENSETTPEVEVTLQKVLDGYPLIYTSATELGCSEGEIYVASGADLAGRQKAKTDVYLTIWPDDKLSAGYDSASAITGACAELVCSGMYVSSVSYTFPVEGTFTEDVTLVGNQKRWRSAAVSGKFTNNSDAPAALTGVGRRQDLNMGSSVFPDDIPGVTTQVFTGGACSNPRICGSYASGGVNARITGEQVQQGLSAGHAVHFSNITVSCDFGGREPIYELGSLKPYYRYVSFPIEVTSEFEVTGVQGDCVVVDDNLGNDGVYCPTETSNLKNQKIVIVTCEGTSIDLGHKNKLQSVNYTGGDTGGGNVTITYSYSNFNDLVVVHNSSDSFPGLGEGS
jgi:hypothetical protein